MFRVVVAYCMCLIVCYGKLHENFPLIGSKQMETMKMKKGDIEIFTYSQIFNKGQDLEDLAPGDIITIDVRVSGSANEKTVINHPILFSSLSPQSSLSWQLPLVVHSHNIFHVRKVLCPLDFVIPEYEESTNETIVVMAKCDSIKPVVYTIQAKQFGSGTFDVEPDVHYKTKSSISVEEPQFFETTFPPNAESIEITVESDIKDAKICGLVLIQNHSCPFLDNLNEVPMGAMHMTFLNRATLLLRRSRFARTVFIVFMTFPDDTPCGGKVKKEMRNTSEKKTIEFQVKTGPNSKDYITPTTILVIAIFLIYVLTFVFLYWVKKKWLQSDSIDVSEVSKESQPENQEPPIANLLQFDIEENSDGRTNSFGVVNPSADMTDTEFSEIAVIQPNVEVRDSNSAKEEVKPKRKRKSKKKPKKECPEMCDSDSDDEICIFERMDNARFGNYMDSIEPHTTSRPYGWLEIVVSLFFILPVAQLMATLWKWRSETGDADVCYHNFECARPLWIFRAFNRIYSNLVYIALGILFLIIVYQRKKLRTKVITMSLNSARNEGTLTNEGMQMALGAALIAEGVISAFYDVCPSNSFLQFDTTFMFMLISLCLFKLYSSRHGSVQPHVFYAVMALLLVVSLLETVSKHKNVLHVLFILCQILIMPILSFQVYYGGHVKDSKGKNFSVTNPRSAFKLLKDMFMSEKSHQHGVKPLFKDRFLMLFVGNIANVLLSSSLQSLIPVNGTRYLLCMMVVYLILYLAYYTANKFFVGERLNIYTWFLLAASILFWGLAIICLLQSVTDWTKTPAESRSLNEGCRLFNFYDIHDLWHITSAIALFLTITLLITVDDDVMHKAKDQITVF